MIGEGDDAPAMTLPGYVDGERRQVDLGEYVGEGIVVLAFYPADFNPGCTMQDSDLGDLDLFTMQKDVSVFGISPDSTYSHEAFADRYSLHIPLLSDRAGEAAEAYGVDLETEAGEHLTKRAVFVIDHRGVVRYAWATDDLEELPDVDPVKRAVGDIGGDETALERYRVGYDHYVEGRDAFTEAMAAYDDSQWMVASNRYAEAEEAFAEAADHLDTAVRFAETADFETVVDRIEEKADALRHAAEWLSDSADAFASGNGASGQQYREDAEPLLDAAKDIEDPAPPERFDLTDDGIELDDSIVVDPEDDEEEGYAWRKDGPETDASLGLDETELDAAADEAVAESALDDDRSDTVEGDLEMDLDAVEADADDEPDDGADAESDESPIEGDTVEGDLEMDLDAVEESADEESAGEESADGATRDDSPAGGDGSAEEGQGSGDPSADAATADGRSGPVDGQAGPADGWAEPADGIEPSPEEGEGAAGPEGEDGAGSVDGEEAGPDDGEEAGPDNGDESGPDGGDDEVLDLTDPTESEDEAGDEDEEEDDDRADWDIPGR